MKKLVSLALVGLFSAALVTGCSNAPSAEELKQLDDLKAEVTSLEREIANRESEKAALLKSIGDKEAQLAQCMKDKAALQAAGSGM
jgi:septal ring factor EnvC (AmiA/AmiB activator)